MVEEGSHQDLMEINGAFLCELKATEGQDTVVDSIGDVLFKQVVMYSRKFLYFLLIISLPYYTLCK